MVEDQRPRGVGQRRGLLVARDSRHERLLLASIFGLTALAFAPTLAGFIATWSNPGREHGFVIGVLTGWLVWRDRERILRSAGRGEGYLVPVLVGLSGVWLLAAIMSLRLLQMVSVFGLAITLALSVFGWSARRRIFVIAGTFAIALPFWTILIRPLQLATTLVSGSLAQLAGISATVGPDYIEIATGTFLVADGCAGLKTMLAGVVLATVYSHVFVERWQTQLKIVALAAAVQIVGNWIRVLILIVLGEVTAMQSPHIENHYWQGWAIFTVLLVPTYKLARRIEIRDRRREREAVAASDRLRDDREAVAADDDQAPSTFDPRRPRRATAAALAAVSGPILFVLLGALPRSSDIEADPGMLGVEDPWAVVDSSTADAWRPKYAGFDREISWTLSDGTRSVSAVRLVYLDQRQGEELIQYENVIAPDSLVADDRVVGPFGESRRFVREAVIRTEAEPRVVWYWYRVGGFETAFSSKAKLLEILAFFERDGVAELVTASVPCAPDNCWEAANTLRSAVGAELLPPLDTSMVATGDSAR